LHKGFALKPFKHENNMNDTHSYEVNLQWNYGTKGTLSSSILPTEIEVATPPDFPNGIAGIWSPEHLFVASKAVS